MLSLRTRTVCGSLASSGSTRRIWTGVICDAGMVRPKTAFWRHCKNKLHNHENVLPRIMKHSGLHSSVGSKQGFASKALAFASSKLAFASTKLASASNAIASENRAKQALGVAKVVFASQKISMATGKIAFAKRAFGSAG